MRALSRGLVTATAGAVAPSPASSSGVNKASGKGGLHNGVPRASGAGFPRGGPDSAGPGAPAPPRGSQAALGRALWWAMSKGGRAPQSYRQPGSRPAALALHWPVGGAPGPMAGTRGFVLSPPKVSLISELSDFFGDQILSCVLGCVFKESGKLVAAGVLAGSH